jgi:hypothetical protein
MEIIPVNVTKIKSIVVGFVLILLSSVLLLILDKFTIQKI